MEKINPIEHGLAMYEIFLKNDKMTHDQALFRALCVACEEQRGRCAEACQSASEGFRERFKERQDVRFDYMAEGAMLAAEAIEKKMPPVNLDKDGILR